MVIAAADPSFPTAGNNAIAPPIQLGISSRVDESGTDGIIGCRQSIAMFYKG